MNPNSQVANLLVRWEQLRALGQIVTPAELCRDCPELLAEVVKKLQLLQNSLDTQGGTQRESTGAAPSRLGAVSGLPTIGDFQIIRELGRGGMGIVYQAYDGKRREMVALKTLLRIDASAVYRLKHEFRALAEVTHPNLLCLYELIATEQQCVIAMELIDGYDFLAYLRSSPDAPDDRTQHRNDRIREALRQLAHGISALHALGQLHRDIKPSNVMVTREGRVVILDFGLAAPLNWAGVHQSTEQHVIGTIVYMAPEQAASQPQSPASDWYSVGVMLYEALTGQLPFQGTPLQVLLDKQQREPPAPVEVAPGIPEDLNQLCVELLRRSPEARPEGHEVLRRLGKMPSGIEAPADRRFVQTARVTLVGRESQLAGLNAAFHSLKSGRSGVVRLHGRSGAGKSMLAQHFLDDLSRREEAVVLAGKCYERESVPYKALDSLIDSLSRHLRHLPNHEAQVLLPREIHLLARVFPVLQRVTAVVEAPGRFVEILDPHELRHRAFVALRELLARLGDRKPLVLFIDDLQWGDLDGATQLAELLRPPEGPVLLLLACYRSEDADASPCLEILQRAIEKADAALDQQRITVDPLGHEEARKLALTLLGRQDAASQAQADTIARESGGSPYFVHELVQCVRARVEFAEGTTAGTPVLDSVLWARIQSLSEAPRRLLEAIAVSGQPLQVSEALEAAGLDARERGVLAALRSGRLIRSSGSAELEEVETYHDRIRETILSHLPAEMLKDLHRRIAVVLESGTSAPSLCGGDPFEASSSAIEAADVGARALKNRTSKRIFYLVYHFDAAGDSVRAYPYATAMADQARSQYALEISEQLYRIAERGATTADSATRCRVAESLGDVLMLRGRYPDAAVRFKAALKLTSDTLKQAQIEGKLGELAFKCGDMKTAIEATEHALRMLGNRVPVWSVTFLFSLLWEAVIQVTHTWFPRLLLARKKLSRAEKQLLTVRLHNRLLYAYWFKRGQFPCLWAHLRGMNLAEQYPASLELAQAYSIHAPVMHLIARFSRGIAYAQRSFVIYKSFGNLWGQGQSQHFHGHVLYAASQFDECIEKCREAVRLLERTGDYWEVNVARYHIALSLYRLGNLTGAVAEAARMHQSGLELGDIQASGGALDPWARACGGRVSPEALATELQRQREDVQGSAMVMLAEGVREFMLDRAEEAASIFEKAYQLAANAGVKNVYTYPHIPWLASALRRQAEKTPLIQPSVRAALLKRAGKFARKALRTARTFQNDLPHALRECGRIAAMQGNVRKGRQFLDESLAVAERQGARFEYAQTLLARGHAGVQHGWPEAGQDLATARQALHELGANFILDGCADT